MINKSLFTSNSDEWSTPADLFQKLDVEFSFTLDPCATEKNAKCKHYYDASIDGLMQSWRGERVFCNPPYSKISQWVEKCYYEATRNKTLIVLLIPARTDTKYFHNFIYHKSQIRFIKGRLKFGDGKGSAPFPSMIVIYNRRS